MQMAVRLDANLNSIAFNQYLSFIFEAILNGKQILIKIGHW